LNVEAMEQISLRGLQALVAVLCFLLLNSQECVLNVKSHMSSIWYSSESHLFLSHVISTALNIIRVAVNVCGIFKEPELFLLLHLEHHGLPSEDVTCSRGVFCI
jgi:hypothetical protein